MIPGGLSTYFPDSIFEDSFFRKGGNEAPTTGAEAKVWTVRRARSLEARASCFTFESCFPGPRRTPGLSEREGPRSVSHILIVSLANGARYQKGHTVGASEFSTVLSFFFLFSVSGRRWMVGPTVVTVLATGSYDVCFFIFLFSFFFFLGHQKLETYGG